MPMKLKTIFSYIVIWLEPFGLEQTIKTEGRKAELNDREANRRKNATSNLTEEKNNHVQHTWVINQLSLAVKSC